MGGKPPIIRPVAHFLSLLRVVMQAIRSKVWFSTPNGELVMNGLPKRGYSGAQRTEMAAERKRWWFIRIGSVKPRELGNSIDLLNLREPIRHPQVARVREQT